MELSKSLLDWQKKTNQEHNITTYDTQGRVTNYGKHVNTGALPSPQASPNAVSYNQKIETDQLKIADIDLKLNNILTRKDELKLIEANKLGNRNSVIQIKTTQNNAYRELQATESELISQKNSLQQNIQLNKDRINQVGLTDQAGKVFSAGISLDPVMDQRQEVSEVPMVPAMSAEERASIFQKEDTLLNPNFTLEDVAQGLTEQGSSYLGGDSTILDSAIASPVLDLQHGLSNPDEYQLAQDYGYTNMDASGKEIAKNPARFAGNVAGFVGAEVALTFGTLGVGKVALKGGKIISTAVKNSNAKKFVKKDIENINKELGLGNDKSITNDVQSSKKLVDEIDPYSSKALNPSGTVDLQSLPKSVQSTVQSGHTKAVSQGISIDGYNFAKSIASTYIKNPKSTPKDFIKREILIDGKDGQMATNISHGITRKTIHLKSDEKIIPPNIMKLAFVEAKAEMPRRAQYAVRQVEGEAHEIEKSDILQLKRNIIKRTDEKIPELQARLWNNYDNIVTGKLLPVTSVKTGYKIQGKKYLGSLKSAKREFEEFGISTGIKKKPPTVRYNTEFGKTLTGVAGASVIGGGLFGSSKKKKNNKFQY